VSKETDQLQLQTEIIFINTEWLLHLFPEIFFVQGCFLPSAILTAAYPTVCLFCLAYLLKTLKALQLCQKNAGNNNGSCSVYIQSNSAGYIPASWNL